MNRVRFSLRTILILMTVFGIVAGPWLYSCTLQKVRLDALRRQGYLVRYIPVGKIRSWIGDRIGDDFVTSPHRLSCNGEADLETVAKLPELQELVLSAVRVNDQELAKIADLPLTFLALSHTDVTDNGIKYMVDMPLISTDLEGLPITDNCVEHLARIKTLRWINISAGAITPEGQQRLKNSLPACTINVNVR